MAVMTQPMQLGPLLLSKASICMAWIAAETCQHPCGCLPSVGWALLRYVSALTVPAKRLTCCHVLL